MLKKSLAIAGSLLSLAVFAEICSFFFLVLGFGGPSVPRVPSYSWRNVVQPKEVKIVPTTFGDWYQPDIDVKISFNRYQGCDLYDLQTNSYGARDIEREKRSDSGRVVVLGDTLMEGMGVGIDSRISNILESRTGIEHMNFSVKNTGSLHHLLTYESLAADFDHDTVVVQLYPYNDFIDADIERKMVFDPKYTGYFLTGAYPDYQMEFHTGYKKPGQEMYIEAVLSEFTHTWHVLLYMKNRVNRLETNPTSPSKYYHFTEDEFQKFIFPLEQLAEKTGDKQVYFVSMPYINDIEAYRQDPDAPFNKRLEEFAQQYEHVEYLDMLQPVSDKTGDKYLNYYYPCNKEHFSREGYALIADLMYTDLYENQVSSRDD